MPNNKTLDIDWPKWPMFRIDLEVKEDELCIHISYDGDPLKNSPWCIKFPEGCLSTPRIDVGEVKDCKIFLRWVEVCHTQHDKHVKGQVWAEYGPFKTKLGEFEIDY